MYDRNSKKLFVFLEHYCSLIKVNTVSAITIMVINCIIVHFYESEQYCLKDPRNIVFILLLDRLTERYPAQKHPKYMYIT